MEGNEYLERFIETLRFVAAGPRYDYAAAAQLIPVAARITEDMDRINFAEAAAGNVFSISSGTPLVSLFARQGLATIAFLRGDAEAASQQYVSLSQSAGTFAKLSNDRILGLLARTMGNLDQAVAHFEDALTFCRQAGYRPELAWSCHDYAEMLLESNTGDRAKAAELLEESNSISSELGMRPLVERVAALRETIESKPARGPEFPDGLTRRESEVIRLVAAGRTDREIGEELFISVKTVGNHVSNILNKTGSANRAEAASYATRHGLATDEDFSN